MKHPAGDGRELLVRTLHVGPMTACCYLIGGSDGAGGTIIDPGDEADRITEAVEATGIAVKQIILTHGHADHIAALEEVRNAFPKAEVMIHADDAPMLERPSLNLSLFLGQSINCTPADRLLHDTEVVELGGLEANVIHVPGHTPGGVCLHVPDAAIVFTGDVLFAGGIGRTDFPGGSEAALLAGIRDKLLRLPPETTVYPGHGPSSTIAHEKLSNPFL